MVALAFLLPAALAPATPEGGSLAVRGGQWVQVGDSRGSVKQASESGAGLALSGGIKGVRGAWRCWVEPALGTKEAGIWFQRGRANAGGFLCTLGGGPTGGFGLRDAQGNVLWSDEWMPWSAYEPYVLEGVVEKARVRIQVFRWDAKTLLSQSEWIAVPEEATARPGYLGYHTLDGIARFWGAERSDTPLSPLTDNAPNKRRLVQSKDSEWALLGTGNWMWTDATRTWARQYANTERAWAINRSLTGSRRTWECRVRVHPPAGGAGMGFGMDAEAKSGFLCWLGGTFGDGCLLLYRLPGEALWGSAEGKWRYDTEYILRAIVDEKTIRVQQLAADGSVIAESPPVEVPPEQAAREGYLGFHTWIGSAEFGAFSGAPQAAPQEPGPPPSPVAQTLGEGWLAGGDGVWQWGDDQHSLLRQAGPCEAASVVTTAIEGIHGVWRCRVKPSAHSTAAGLLFQVDQTMREGFALTLVGPPEAGRVTLEELSTGRVLWENAKCPWKPDTEYVLEGEVLTDRVVVRVVAADGETVLAESPACYVSARNNERRGHLGLRTGGGGVEFSDWSLK